MSGFILANSVLTVFLVILAILWFILPFAIFGTKKKLDLLIESSGETNRLLAKLAGENTESTTTLTSEVQAEQIDEVETKKNDNEINLELIEQLKGIKAVGFNKKFSACDICHLGKTGQIISNHYVCSNCKTKYL